MTYGSGRQQQSCQYYFVHSPLFSVGVLCHLIFLLFDVWLFVFVELQGDTISYHLFNIFLYHTKTTCLCIVFGMPERFSTDNVLSSIGLDDKLSSHFFASLGNTFFQILLVSITTSAASVT